ncbi:hypothetical protein P4O66_011032, partial [Electrophorus voltai]
MTEHRLPKDAWDERLPQQGKVLQEDFWGALSVVQDCTLRSPTDLRRTTGTGTVTTSTRSLTQQAPMWTTRKAMRIMERVGSLLTLVSSWTRNFTVWEILMEVEEVFYKDPPSAMDTASADSKSDEPSATKAPPKAPPRVFCSGASKLPCVNHREAASSSHQDTPLPKEHSPRACALMPKPCRGKRERHQCPPQRQAKQLVRLLAIPIHVTLSVPIALPVPISVTIPVFVVVFVPVFLPSGSYGVTWSSCLTIWHRFHGHGPIG